MTHCRRLWFVCLALALLAPPGAPAQDTPAAPREDPEELPVILEEIVVTAQKREENLQEVPISIVALTSVRIEEAGIQTPEDFISLVPNVSIGHSFTVGNSFLNIRGIAQLNNSDPPVAVVVDGVYQGNQKQFFQELFDIERIEVLKGPQGALYGRNSLGGAINIITRQPGERLEGFVRVGGGNGGSYGLSAGFRGPWKDPRLRFSAAASYKESAGLIENVHLRRKADFYEDASGRVLFKWLPSECAWVDLRAATSRTEGGAVFYSIFPTEGHANDFGIRPDESILGFSRREMDDVTLRVVVEGLLASFTSITGASDLSETYRGDADFSHPARRGLVFPFGQVGQGQDHEVRLLSQEIRFASIEGERIEWMAGAYIQETDRGLDSFGFLDTDGSIAGFVPFLKISEDNDNRAFAFFAQVAHPFKGRLYATAGLRFDRDERRQKDLGTGHERRAAFDRLQPKLALRFQASEKLMVYLSASSGFRSGGFNAPSATPQIFSREVSGTVELGWKSMSWQDRVRFNGAAYLARVDGAQYFLVDFTRGGQIIDNIRQVEIRGLEADLHARLRGGWDLFASTGFNDSRIEDFDGTRRFVGNQIPSNLRFKLNLGTQYTRSIFDGLLASGRVEVEQRGRQYWHADNIDVQDPFALVNLRAGLEGERWGGSLWVRNAFDQRYYVEYGDRFWFGNYVGGDIGHPGRPRSFGIELRRSL